VLNETYRAHAPLWSRDSDAEAFTRLGGPVWNPNVIAFARRDNHGNTVATIANFSGAPVYDYTISLPEQGTWTEVLNTDAHEYGGSGVGNLGSVQTGSDGAATMVLPPLGVLWF